MSLTKTVNSRSRDSSAAKFKSTATVAATGAEGQQLLLSCVARWGRRMWQLATGTGNWQLARRVAGRKAMTHIFHVMHCEFNKLQKQNEMEN